MLQQKMAIKVKLFAAFAHPVRLQILEELEKGERCVTELVQFIKNASQSQVSNHLNCLRDCGLVKSRREWRKIYYSLADPRIAQLLRTADEILPEVASKIAACPEIASKTERKGGAKHNH